MPDVPSSVTAIASLGDSLTALTQRLQSAAARQGSTLYFDYVGLTLFPAADVAALTQCVTEMVGDGIAQAGAGHGSVFLSVYAWPQSVDKARVTVQLAHTTTSGLRALGKLSSMCKEPASSAACDTEMMLSAGPDGLSAAFSEGVDAACTGTYRAAREQSSH